MQTYILAAGAIPLAVGVMHSTLGEVLIFRHLCNRGLVLAVEVPTRY